MFKKVAVIAGSGVLGLALLFLAANRSLSEMFTYFRAGASTTVKSIEKEIPDVIHDEKTRAELNAARQQLVDRQVQLSLSQNQLKGLESEIAALSESIETRKAVLASAYPVLQTALDGRQSEVTFVSTKFTLDDFQRELDDLLAMQQRDETALKTNQQGHQRLAASIAEGESALSGLTMEQIAGDLNVSLSTAYRWHSEARAELRQTLSTCNEQRS